MIVIIEGCDLVGKSTLAKALTEKHGWQIVKIRWALRGDSERQRTVSMASAFAPCNIPQLHIDTSLHSAHEVVE